MFLVFLAFVLYPASLLRAATKIYLNSSVSDLNPGADDERDITASAGSSVFTCTMDTLAGPVTPPTATTQMTVSAGGAALTWLSKPLG